MSNIRRLLLIDADKNMRDTLCEQMNLHDEFDLQITDCWATAITHVNTDKVDLIITSKQEAYKNMRNNGFKGPIIMLMGNEAEALALQKLNENDTIIKPFRFATLLARIKVHLRQYEGSEDAVFQIGSYSFRPSAKLLITSKGAKLRLTEKETAILRYLHRANEKTVSRDILLQEVWGYNPNVTTHTLETHIYRLRQKIEPDPAAAKLLITELGGYRLVS